MKKEIIGKRELLIFLIGIVLLLPACSAIIEFYSGNIELSQAVVNVEIGDKNININGDYIFRNIGDKKESVSLSLDSFFGDTKIKVDGKELSGDLEIGAGESKKIAFSYSYENNEKSLNFPCYMKLNGLRLGKPTPVIRYNVKFSGIQGGVISSKPQLTKESSSGSYSFTSTNDYLTTLFVSWINFEPKVKISQQASYLGKDSINIIVILENYGESEVRDLRLVQSFPASFFEPLSPSDEFKYFETLDHSAYSWDKSIGALEAGKKSITQHSLKLKSVGGDIGIPEIIILSGTTTIGFSDTTSLGPVIVNDLSGSAGSNDGITPSLGNVENETTNQNDNFQKVPEDILYPNLGKSSNGIWGILILGGIIVVVLGVIIGLYYVIRKIIRERKNG